MAKNVLVPSALDPEEWRQYADMISMAMRFNLERVYLDAPSDQLKNYLRYRGGNTDNAAQATSWLRLDRIGEISEKGLLDPSTAIQIALSSCHRPGNVRLLFAVHGDGNRHSVYLGLRSLNHDIESIDVASPTGAFIEANWPATRLTQCSDSESPQGIIENALGRYKGRYAITGVPAFLDRDKSRHPQSLDLLLDGMRGRRFLYLVVADPLPIVQQAQIVSRARDLIGGLHVLARSTITRSASDTIGTSHGTTDSVVMTDGHSISTGDSRNYTTASDFLKLAAVGSLGLAALYPPMALFAGLAGLSSLLMPQSRSYTRGRSDTTSTATSKGTTETSSQSNTNGVSMAREYVNAHVEAIVGQLRRIIERTDGQKIWEAGAYLLTEYDQEGQDATAQLASLLNGSRRHGEEPIRFENLRDFWHNQVQTDLISHRRPRFEVVSENNQTRLDHPLGQASEGLSTPLNSEELSLLISFPRREVPGIKSRPYAAFALNPAPADDPAIELGDVLRGDDPIGSKMKVSVASLAKNILVTGTVGSGKSVTCRSLLQQLLDVRMPFLVIEPAKTEYVDWAKRINDALPEDSPDRIRIYVPGARAGSFGPDQAKLKLNPFHVVSPDYIVPHIERLKTLLTLALPMQESLPLLLEGILYGIYSKNGWFSDSASPRNEPKVPTIAQILATRFTEEFVRSKGYEEKVASNLVGALTTRLEALRAGPWKKELFDCEKSTQPGEIFGHPTIVNLSYLGNDRPLAAGLLMEYLHEWRQADSESVVAPGLRHLVVLEEAHCLLEPVRHVAAESMDPKGMVSRLFSDLLSEMRAWGQGFMLVDQYPTRLILDAIKNTNLKIVHRLPSRDDQEVIAAAMSLDPVQARLLPYLLPGQAIVLGDRDDAPLRIQVVPKGGMAL